MGIVILGVYSAVQPRELHLSEPFIWGIGWGMVVGPIPAMIGTAVCSLKRLGHLVVTTALLVKEWYLWRKGVPSSEPY